MIAFLAYSILPSLASSVRRANIDGYWGNIAGAISEGIPVITGEAGSTYIIISFALRRHLSTQSIGKVPIIRTTNALLVVLVPYLASRVNGGTGVFFTCGTHTSPI